MNYDEAAEYWIEKDKDSVQLDSAALKDKINAFIRENNTCALATASEDFVRCTPIEYNYLNGCFYLFSEGGLKFKALKDNKHVALAIYESFSGFANLKSLQVMGTAEMVEPFSEEYLMLLKFKSIPENMMKKLTKPMNLIKIIPDSFDYLDSDLKKDGFGNRQHLDVIG